MNSIVKIIPWLSAILIYFLSLQIINKPKLFYYIAPVIILVVFFATLSLIKFKIKEKEFWQILIAPIINIISLLSFMIFIELRWIKITLVIFLAIVLGLFLYNIYLYKFKPQKYQTFALQNFSYYLNLISVFLLFSSFFGFIVFLQIAWWPLLLAVIIISILSIYQLMWASNINLNSSWLYILIISLIIGQGFWVLAFLPTSIYVNSLILTAIYYLTVGLSLNKLLGILEKSVIKRYVTILTIVILITLISAKWI